LADRVVAVDANAETLALNTADAELVRADVFEWESAERFDLVFFSFWLSHVPEERFDAFWKRVRAALVPGGRIFLVDSGAGDRAHTGTDQADGEETRARDGRVIAAANVENAAYPLGVCAERAAIAKAASDGLRPGDAEAIAITASPCGGCRQWLHEWRFERVHFRRADGTVATYAADELLPETWDLPEA